MQGFDAWLEHEPEYDDDRPRCDVPRCRTPYQRLVDIPPDLYGHGAHLLCWSHWRTVSDARYAEDLWIERWRYAFCWRPKGWVAPPGSPAVRRMAA